MPKKRKKSYKYNTKKKTEQHQIKRPKQAWGFSNQIFKSKQKSFSPTFNHHHTSNLGGVFSWDFEGF
jgi:hypothetical protein